MRHVFLKAFLFVAAGLTLFARGEAAFILHTATYGGHTYHLVVANQNQERIHWAPAQAFAVSLGGNLVTVNDAAENTFLLNTFGPVAIAAANTAHPSRNLISMWIGFSDAASEGNWVWVSGEPVRYTNWAFDQPVPFDNDEAYAAMLVDTRYVGALPGQWHDVHSVFRDPPSGIPHDVTYGIIEISSIDVVPEPATVTLRAFAMAGAFGVQAARRRF